MTTEIKTPDWALASRQLADGRVLLVVAFHFGARLTIGERLYGYTRGYDYDAQTTAILAMETWNPETEPDPAGWYRCLTDGRRRPGGDASKEYVQE